MSLEYTAGGALSDDASAKYISISVSSRLSVPRPTLSPPAPLVHRQHRGQPPRSSPLAGPVLSSDLSAIEAETDPEPWCLTPNLPTLLQPSLSTSSSKASKASRHVSFAAVASTLYLATSTPSHREGRVKFDGVDDLSIRHVQIPTVQEINTADTHDIGCGTHSKCSLSATPRRSGTSPTTTRIRHSPHFLHSPPLDSSEHWMTFNTYDTTPRFSRLSLAAPNVILPVPARLYVRGTSKKLASSVGLRSTRTNSSTMSIASSMRVASSSAKSSNETLAISSHHGSAPSIASASEMGTIVAEVDDGTTSIDISSPPPIKEGIQLKASSFNA